MNSNDFNKPLTFFKLESSKNILLPLFSSSVKAGFPSPADDFIENHIDLNKLLISHVAETYLVRVSGNSMKNAEIYSEDILIVDRSLEIKENSIGIFTINDEFTVKRIKKINGILYLYPENDQYKPIKIEGNNELSVWGVVTFIIHQCK